jgi:uncharacterized protein (DUF934 family)
MPLMRNAQYVTDTYVILNDTDALPDSVDIIVPLARIEDAKTRLQKNDARIGVHVPNTAKPDQLKALFNEVSLISIAFPSFSDGRGFSIAKRLRRDGFTGTLRATGPLIADQYAHAKACGFDEIAVPDTLAARQDASQWQHSANAISLSYQRGYHRPATILDRRRASLLAAE